LINHQNDEYMLKMHIDYNIPTKLNQNSDY